MTNVFPRIIFIVNSSSLFIICDNPLWLYTLLNWLKQLKCIYIYFIGNLFVVYLSTRRLLCYNKKLVNRKKIWIHNERCYTLLWIRPRKLYSCVYTYSETIGTNHCMITSYLWLWNPRRILFPTIWLSLSAYHIL